MIKLEETLIEAAEQSLREAKLFSDNPKSNDLYISLYELRSYIYSALTEYPGLSEECTAKLTEIEKQSTEIMKTWMQMSQQN